MYNLGLNDLQKAEIEALSAFHMNPADPRHGTLLAQIYEKRNVPALAIAACEEVLASPVVTPTASFVYFTGTLYEKAQRYNEARDRYLQAIAIDSVYAPAYKNLAGLFQLAKQNDRASKVYLKYTELAPDDVDAFIGLAESLNDAGRSAQALSAANRAMELDSTRSDVRLAYARAAIKSRNPAVRNHGAATFAALEGSVTLQADDYVSIAAYQMDSKDLDAARGNLARAIEADSTSASAYFQLGQLAFKTGQPDSAASYFEAAIRLDPKTPLYYLNLGVARFQMKDMDRALPAFREAIALDPRSALAHNLLGQALASMDSLSSAATEYDKALALEPNNGRALRGIGFCHLRASEHDKAVDAYRLATAADPKNAEGWVGLGQAYLGLRDLPEAESAFRKAQAIDPSNPSVKQGMEIISQSRRSSGGR
jgi:tetratricopeptide (TPR) repeat protein